VLFWAFGPGILLLFLRPTHPRRGHCPRCGYLLRGLPEPRCPECGRPFTAQEVGMTHEQLQNVEPDE
jgi:predicted amidophosphoribosyltransferase